MAARVTALTYQNTVPGSTQVHAPPGWLEQGQRDLGAMRDYAASPVGTV